MKYLLILLFLFSFSSAWALPECEGSPYKGDDLNKIKHWDNCEGTHAFNDGAKFVGEFKGGLPNGQGNFTNANGDKYVGEHKDGIPNGKGTNTWTNGNKYVGEWKDNIKHGQGTYTFANGEKYVGEWKDDLRNGKGTNTWTNGNKYVGEWKDGLKHGQGTAILATGIVKVGEWREDKWIGGKKYAAGEYQSNDTLIDEAKATCKEIGFQEKTEKFGECVVELYKGMAKSQLTTNTNTSTNKELLEIETRRLAIEEDKASRDKWGNIGKVLRDLSKSPNNNTPNNNSNSSACYSECRTSNPNATIRYCKSICRY